MVCQVDSTLIADLHATGGAIETSVALSELSRWQIGGCASLLIEPPDAHGVASILRVIKRHDVPLIVIGETSNLLFDSKGFHGVLLRIGKRMSRYAIDGSDIQADAGVSVGELARAAGRAGLTGIEHVVGIPGTLGGLVLMNGGSQRRAIGDHVMSVGFISEDGERLRLTREELGFSYRFSKLQQRRGVLVDVELRLEFGEAATILAEMDAIVGQRASKFPLEWPNCGSTFLSNPSMYAVIGPPGKAIEEVGLKGVRAGGAEISHTHANFIVNLGGATDDDVLRLIALARRTVYARTGYMMDCEVRHVSVGGSIRPAHEVADERWGHVDITALA